MTQTRIGILTYHRSNNYGAFMQAYSLSTRVAEDFPECEVSVIDYISEEVYLHYRPSFINDLKLIVKAKPCRRKLTYAKLFYHHLRTFYRVGNSGITDKNFEDALKTLRLSGQYMITDSLKKVSDYINENFDIVVVGSDAVWNWQARQFPNVYFLGNEVKVKKLSYAASSYGQPFKQTSDRQKAYISKAWRDYQYIGVRDIPTEDFVRWVDKDLNPHHNCDPTVFLNMISLPVDVSVVKEKLRKAGFDFNRKSIGLMAKHKVAKFVCNELGDDYQIVSVFNKNECASINLLDINPFEWAVVFSFFDLTITHYFHGNLLSLKSGTPTLIIEEKSSYNLHYCSKIRDFMRRVGLEENCHYLDEIDASTLKGKVGSILRDTEIKGKIEMGLQAEANNYDSFNNALTRAINDN